MGNRRYSITEEDIQNRYRAGRGQGAGIAYTPWIYTYEFPSKGRRHRSLGHKVERLYHLMSDVEFSHFVYFDRLNSVIDNREQFPLNRDDTIRIADKLGFRHPKYPGTKVDAVMTTDFLLTLNTPSGQKLRAFSTKHSSDLLVQKKKRLLEKLKIEQCYWNERGAEWYASTERALPQQLISGINWVRDAYDLSSLKKENRDTLFSAALFVLAKISNEDSKLPLNQWCLQLDGARSYDRGTHLGAAKHLIAQQLLEFDLGRPHPWTTPVANIRVRDCSNSVSSVITHVWGDSFDSN